MFRSATEAVDRALKFAYRDRKARKRDFRKLWIVRINAAVRPFGLSYSRFMHLIKEANIAMDRKMLSELAISDPQGFSRIVEAIRPQAA